MQLHFKEMVVSRLDTIICDWEIVIGSCGDDGIVRKLDILKVSQIPGLARVSFNFFLLLYYQSV